MKNLIIVLSLSLFAKTGICQSLENGFNYFDNTISDREIKKCVAEMLATIDSVMAANDFYRPIEFHVGLYFADSSGNTKSWLNFQKRFTKVLIKKVGGRNVIIHPTSLIGVRSSIKKERLSIGPIFVEK